MKKNELYRKWIEEEKNAQITGWDFSHIHGRYSEEHNLQWDFRKVIRKYLRDDMNLLDMETGGGEFLLSLEHPYSKTSAIEGYKPNVEYCKKKLPPLGINFKEADGENVLPFDENTFDIVTNRHGAYNISEIRRVLKKGGIFLTQQVGAENDRDLIRLLQPEITKPPFSEHYLGIQKRKFEESGFEILECGESMLQPIRFYDTGALVWFAKIIEWEFENFSVDTHLDNLYKAQELLEKNGAIEGHTHRFYFAARKK